jgi:hypothetical protein
VLYCATALQNTQEREKELEGMFDAELDRDDKAAMEASAAETGAVPGMHTQHTHTHTHTAVVVCICTVNAFDVSLNAVLSEARLALLVLLLCFSRHLTATSQCRLW